MPDLSSPAGLERAFSFAVAAQVVGLLLAIASGILAVSFGGRLAYVRKVEVADAQRRAAESNQLAAQAAERTEALQHQNVVLLKRLGPRTVTAADYAALVTSLSGLGGRTIQTLGHVRSPEAREFALLLRSALTAAHLKVDRVRDFDNLDVSGVVVGAGEARRHDADRLVRAFVGAGLGVAHVDYLRKGKDNELDLWVGWKPD